MSEGGQRALRLTASALAVTRKRKHEAKKQAEPGAPGRDRRDDSVEAAATASPWDAGGRGRPPGAGAGSAVGRPGLVLSENVGEEHS